jgi:hypothetical protein
MARRPTGPKATARNGAVAGPARSAGPARPARPKAPARHKEPARPAASASPERSAPDVTGGPPGLRPAFTRLAGLRLAAAAEALEAAGLAAAGVFAAVSTAEGRSYQLAGGIAATLIAIATAAGLAGLATCLALARPWTRIPTAITQLFVIIVGITLLQGHRPEWGVPALVLAGACVAGLATPASLRALNRPPITPQTGQEGR